MLHIYSEIAPLILLFLVGFGLRKAHIFKKGDGDILLNLVFYVALPALIIDSVSQTRPESEFIYLPFIAAAIILAGFGIGWITGKWLTLETNTFGTYLVGAMILNIGFVLPFVMAMYGNEGLTRIIIMDMGNGIMVMTFVYYQACRFGSHAGSAGTIIKRFLLNPPLWAIVLGLIFNFSGWQIAGIPLTFLNITGDLTIPLLMLTIGIYFSPSLVKFKALVMVIFIRMGIGLGLGFLFVWLFNFDGVTRMIVLLGSSTPIGYNTLTFAAMEDLDRDFAASIVSVSILVGLVYLPLIIYFFG
ncbi:MAG: AEC family transporter [Bacteroidales bacterium]|nr:AEC family transporter [Bacteroidales bacterium]